MSRRIALKRPKKEEIVALREEIEKLEREGGQFEALVEKRKALEQILLRSKRIPYIDPVDVRFRRLESNPKPIAKAVMFCLMDVSGSMNEHMKDLAKRFYSLLYLFLNRRYEHVDVVFIRHTHEASEWMNRRSSIRARRAARWCRQLCSRCKDRTRALSNRSVEYLRRASQRRRQHVQR
jgi:hypothetical protein